MILKVVQNACLVLNEFEGDDSVLKFLVVVIVSALVAAAS